MKLRSKEAKYAKPSAKVATSKVLNSQKISLPKMKEKLQQQINLQKTSKRADNSDESKVKPILGVSTNATNTRITRSIAKKENISTQGGDSVITQTMAKPSRGHSKPPKGGITKNTFQSSKKNNTRNYSDNKKTEFSNQEKSIVSKPQFLKRALESVNNVDSNEQNIHIQSPIRKKPKTAITHKDVTQPNPFFNGLINRLPNELLCEIFLLHFKPQQLLHLRRVCVRWAQFIEAFLFTGERAKRCLILATNEFNDTKLVNRFFGDINLDDFARFNIKQQCGSSNFVRDFGPLLLHFFPNLTHLVVQWYQAEVISLWPTNKITSLSLYNGGQASLRLSRQLAVRVNSLISLERVDFCGRFGALLPKLGPTLSRVRHFSYQRLTASEDRSEFKDLFGRFSRNVSKVWFDDRSFSRDWKVFNLYGHSTGVITTAWLNSLTHLHIRHGFGYFALLRWSKHMSRLQVLHMPTSSLVVFSPHLVHHLSTLTSLTELSLGWCYIDLWANWGVIEQVIGGLVPFEPQVHRQLRTVHTLSLSLYQASMSGGELCQVLSTIFPELRHLTIGVDHAIAPQMADIEHNWHHFPRLVQGTFKRARFQTTWGV